MDMNSLIRKIKTNMKGGDTPTFFHILDNVDTTKLENCEAFHDFLNIVWSKVQADQTMDLNINVRIHASVFSIRVYIGDGFKRPEASWYASNHDLKTAWNELFTTYSAVKRKRKEALENKEE